MLFHRDIYFPAQLKCPQGKFVLKYGSHAKQRAALNAIPIPTILDTAQAVVIEAELVHNKVVKILYRLAYDSMRDILLAVDVEHWFIKTIWANRKNDTHKTLNRSAYARA